MIDIIRDGKRLTEIYFSALIKDRVNTAADRTSEPIKIKRAISMPSPPIVACLP